MNEEQKDKGLKRALKERPQFHLPSNIAYRTLQKVEESILLHEQKVERHTLWVMILVSLLLSGSCIAGAIYFCGEAIKTFFKQSLTTISHESIYFPTLNLMLVAAIPLLLLFDRWLRKQYFKRNQ